MNKLINILKDKNLITYLIENEYERYIKELKELKELKGSDYLIKYDYIDTIYYELYGIIWGLCIGNVINEDIRKNAINELIEMAKH